MLPILGEVAVSHRKRVNRRHEPDDLLGVIAANRHVLWLGRFFQESLREGVQFSLLSAAVLCWAQVAIPWTNSWADKLPFLGFALAYSAIYCALVHFWGCFGRVL